MYPMIPPDSYHRVQKKYKIPRYLLLLFSLSYLITWGMFGLLLNLGSNWSIISFIEKQKSWDDLPNTMWGKTRGNLQITHLATCYLLPPALHLQFVQGLFYWSTQQRWQGWYNQSSFSTIHSITWWNQHLGKWGTIHDASATSAHLVYQNVLPIYY